LVLALAASGCGESERDKFVERANKVCEEGSVRVKKETNDPDEALRIGSEIASKLDALEAPEEIRADYDRFTKLQVAYWKELTAALKEHDSKRIAAVDEHTGDDLAKKLGLTSCDG